MVKRLRLKWWRWRWDRHWDQHLGALYDAKALGLTPRPPDLDYRGERVDGLCDRCMLLLAYHLF